MHVHLVKELLEQEVGAVRANDFLLRRIDTIKADRRRVLVDCAPEGSPPARLAFAGEHYDIAPLSMSVLDLDTGGPLPGACWPGALYFGSDHPVLKRPFACLRGLLEYHVHPSHIADPWDRLRFELRLTDCARPRAQSGRCPMSVLRVHQQPLEEARMYFELRGKDGFEEGTAMLAGPVGEARRCIIPGQIGRRGPRGVSVKVTMAGKLQLASALGADGFYHARIHSHPRQAFHSITDDRNPGLTAEGSFSIVVPDFRSSFAGWAGRVCDLPASRLFLGGNSGVRTCSLHRGDAMNDPRVELASLTGEDDSQRVVTSLDRYRIVVSAPAERCVSVADQAAIFNAVNLLSRTFAHIAIEVPEGEPWRCRLLPGGSLRARLISTAAKICSPQADPEAELHLAWGQQPSGVGVAADAAGWSYSFGARHVGFGRRNTDNALGGLASTSFAAGQLLGRALYDLGLPYHAVESVVSNLLNYRNAPAPMTRLSARSRRC